ncbi:transcription factor bHLH93-like [Carica papaya]|uniref:transcription factor bHLH93-like n=1 Tax=Carica papaya TaxID=3649 RepID=UPI000B8CAD89|nr:transcription factor bHLH93-like [Carica papaya]
MELNQQDYLEELLGLRRDTWDNSLTFTETNEDFFFSNNDWKNLSFDGFDTDLEAINLQNSFFTTEEFSGKVAGGDFCYSSFDLSTAAANSSDVPFADDNICGQQITNSSQNTFDTPPFHDTPPLQDTPPFHMQEDCNSFGLAEDLQACFQVESPPVFSIRRKNGRGKKMEGQPSKNLMAERRRRKRLNDRLSMLRSIVPNISKMDRTSILGDTIEYMKGLMERIKTLQQKIEEGGSDDQLNMVNIFRDVKKPNEILIRNSPKFVVERRSSDTRIELCCAGKPGLLLSTVHTLEALGLEIQKCVISCFNDFAMQASCSEEIEQRRAIGCEDIKQELFRNAGYGGRCL